MKITKKQREAIIKDTIFEIENKEVIYLCNAFGKTIQCIFDIPFFPNPENVQKYIPEFKRLTAIKHFNADIIEPGINDHCNHEWWDSSELSRVHRLKFLNYLLTDKLPKKKVKK